jgi:hypothetical protein
LKLGNRYSKVENRKDSWEKRPKIEKRKPKNGQRGILGAEKATG